MEPKIVRVQRREYDWSPLGGGDPKKVVLLRSVDVGAYTHAAIIVRLFENKTDVANTGAQFSVAVVVDATGDDTPTEFLGDTPLGSCEAVVTGSSKAGSVVIAQTNSWLPTPRIALMLKVAPGQVAGADFVVEFDVELVLK